MLLSLYLHIPFCKRKCLYCDFCSVPATAAEMESYCDALVLEMALAKASLPEAQIRTLFIGGGTPSVLPAPLMDKLLTALHAHFSVESGAEFTLEMNPGTVTPEFLRLVQRQGVNRLSLGLQAAQDRLLGALGRVHTFAQAMEAVGMLREAGFANFNLDVMFGLPGQSLQEYLDTLAQAVALSPTHISAYSLILEETTPLFASVQRGDCALPEEDAVAEMYEAGRDFLEAAGYQQYEISNFAKPGYECHHNRVYWQGGWYLGLGASGASLLPGQGASPEGEGSKGAALALRRENVADLAQYEQAVRSGRLPVAETHHITKEEAMFETLMLGLRTLQGVAEKAFLERFGVGLEEVYGEVLASLVSEGLAYWEGTQPERRLVLTQRGLLVQNQVLVRLMPA